MASQGAEDVVGAQSARGVLASIGGDRYRAAPHVASVLGTVDAGEFLRRRSHRGGGPGPDGARTLETGVVMTAVEVSAIGDFDGLPNAQALTASITGGTDVDR
ncbi:hypothetical protein [Blastococcus deserti]|uniref:Uncharacterized protein n=1 Tax=Blastococcus deserti TaxID=2259033 RepID=A0ABW4XDF6_9ACTN